MIMSFKHRPIEQEALFLTHKIPMLIALQHLIHWRTRGEINQAALVKGDLTQNPEGKQLQEIH